MSINCLKELVMQQEQQLSQGAQKLWGLVYQGQRELIQDQKEAIKQLMERNALLENMLKAVGIPLPYINKEK